MKKHRLDDAIHRIRSIDFGDERNAAMTAIEEGIAQSPNIKNLYPIYSDFSSSTYAPILI
jgi:hypothetical protein